MALLYSFIILGIPEYSVFNPIALRNAKIVCNFGLSECNRVKKSKRTLLTFVCPSQELRALSLCLVLTTSSGHGKSYCMKKHA